jgi:hypothetical protein
VNDVDRWIYFDGPEPESVRLFLDALRDLPPATPQDKEHLACHFFERLDAALASGEEPPSEEEAPESEVGPPSAPLARPSAPLARPDVQPPVVRVAEDGATARSPSAPSFIEERIETTDPPEPNPSASPREIDVVYAGGVVPRPPVVRAPEIFTSTAPLEFPAELRAPADALPFKPPVPGKPRAARTQQVPVMPAPGLGETAPLGDDSIAKALAALPFMFTVGAGVVLFPRFTIEQYASLRAELAVWPARSAEILVRYHVLDEAARGALDAHWQKHFAEHPEARAAFESGLAAYTRWLHAQPA